MSTTTQPGWERQLVEKLATDALLEKRRRRRWGIFFKLFVLIWLTAVVWFVFLSQPGLDHLDISSEHTAVVRLQGVISDTEGVEADRIIEGLQEAFDHPGTQAVILRINSPGGLPVQSSHIHKAVVHLRQQYPDTPLYAVVDDICASGAYYIAAAADRIYVNESSIVGSIGVRLDSFGFTGAMEKIGVERRLYTAGSYKGMLDPFSPVTEAERQHTDQMLNDMHQTFIQAVQAGRGDRLSDNPDLFSGLVWTGQRSIQLGLADAIGNTGSVARDVVQQTHLVDFTPQIDPLERLADHLMLSVSQTIQHLLARTAQFIH
ncbi:MAG: S49 family peptidase [Pseudomonadota bacterium]